MADKGKVDAPKKAVAKAEEKAADGSAASAMTEALAAEKLAAGLLVVYQPELEKAEKQLKELTAKQQGLLEQLQSENCKFNSVQETRELQEMMATMRLYHGKLTALKKDMNTVLERTAKLKKRALRLQQSKQREALARTHQREERLQREQQLIAGPSGSTATSANVLAAAASPASEPGVQEP